MKARSPHATTIRTFHLPHVTIEEATDGIHTDLANGSSCSFAPPHVDNDPLKPITGDFLEATIEMGYADPWRYAVEHEIAHHLVAQYAPLCEPHVVLVPKPGGGPGEAVIFSRIVYRACHGLELNMQQEESKAEEHLVNRLQRYANLGEPDPYGQLERVFGDRLGGLALALLFHARPWLSVRSPVAVQA